MSIKSLFKTVLFAEDVESLTFKQIYFTMTVIGKFMQNSKYKRKLFISTHRKSKKCHQQSLPIQYLLLNGNPSVYGFYL